MDLSNVFKKASNLFHHKPLSDSLKSFDEIIFGKNNVCVHSTVSCNDDLTHNPGYLTLSYKYKKTKRNEFDNFTLLLTWIPNSDLEHHKSLDFISKYVSENLTKAIPNYNDFRNIPILRKSRSNNELLFNTRTSTYDTSHFINSQNSTSSISSSSSICSDEWILFDTTDFSQNKFPEIEDDCIDENQNRTHQDTNCTISSEFPYLYTQLKCRTRTTESDKNKYVDKTISNPVNKAERFFDKRRKLINHFRTSFSEESNETKKRQYDLVNAKNICPKFTIDLGEMRSLRIFFSPNDETNGQLVIASKENKYKILHFHYGGLEKLLEILQQWGSSFFIPVSVQNEDITYRHFIIREPFSKKSKFNSKQYKQVTNKMWTSMLNNLGQIEDEMALKKAIFFGGLDKNIRKIVWPFLLNCYSYDSTYEERNQINIIHEQKYQIIDKIKNDILETNEEDFLRNIEYLIYKDVIRTDRTNSFYKGDDNPNLKTMQNILLNYTVLYNDYGYNQGMSDLLAPILAEIQNESETFWCFVGLMKRCLFVCTPTDSDMEKNLKYLSKLICIMHPTFHSYLKTQSDGMNLLFCHRWLLLCFKREFPLNIVLHIWEACWSNYLTDYFHLFVALAIIITYSEDVLKNKLNSDEMLFYFNSLAMRMDGRMILQKARELLYSFRSLPQIPSTLSLLCQPNERDVWDNTRVLITEPEEFNYTL